MKKMILALMVVCLLGLGGQAFAELCTIDAVPAATLLVPYFQVDVDNPAGVTTLFSVNNASAAPALAHVIMWTNWSAPTIDFDLFLTGYDVQTVNVRDLFDGNLPITADEQTDPTDTISPHADHPAWDGSFPNCQSILPFTNPAIRSTAFDRLSNGHTGQPVASLGGRCLGGDVGTAVGYITIDNVSECSLVLDPNDAGYFGDGGTGIVNNINQLWGDWFLVDVGNNFAQGDVLVHIEANDDLNATQIPLLDRDDVTVATIANATNYTFYGRYTQALGGVDNREPLGTSWGVRYLNGGDVFSGTDLIAWRDSTANDVLPAGETCGVGPSWFPLNEVEVVAFDEAEDAEELCFFTGGRISPPDEADPACFPYETGRYAVGPSPLNPSFDFGWFFLNLGIPVDNPIGDVDFPAGDGASTIAQSYVVALYNADGLFSVGLPAVQLTNATQDVELSVTAGNNIPFGEP